MLTLILRSGVRLPAGAITYPSPNSSQYFQDIAHRLCPPSELSGSSRCEQMGRAVYGDDDVLMQGEMLFSGNR